MKVLILILLGAVMFFSGFMYYDEPPEVEYVEVPVIIDLTQPTKTIYKTLYKVKEVDRIVYKEKIIYKDVLVPLRLREFKNSVELRDWLAQFEIPFLYDGATMEYILNASYRVEDCDDYARSVQLKALDDGFIISLALTRSGKIFGEQVTTVIAPHMGLLAVIGNDIVYFEPYPPYDLVFFAEIDEVGGLTIYDRQGGGSIPTASPPPKKPKKPKK